MIWSCDKRVKHPSGRKWPQALCLYNVRKMSETAYGIFFSNVLLKWYFLLFFWVIKASLNSLPFCLLFSMKWIYHPAPQCLLWHVWLDGYWYYFSYYYCSSLIRWRLWGLVLSCRGSPWSVSVIPHPSFSSLQILPVGVTLLFQSFQLYSNSRFSSREAFIFSASHFHTTGKILRQWWSFGAVIYSRKTKINNNNNNHARSWNIVTNICDIYGSRVDKMCKIFYLKNLRGWILQPSCKRGMM